MTAAPALALESQLPERVRVASVLAIDPGPVQSAHVIYSRGQIVSWAIEPNADLLWGLARIAQEQAPGTMLAIEMIASYGMPVGREVFETCVWIGRFQQAWHDPASVLRVTRLKVKMHLCGSARAKDPNIWQALIDRFGPVGSKSDPGKLYGVRSHARAALALAVTVADGAA